MPRRRRTAADLQLESEHGVDLFSARRNHCRWPITDVSPISDFRYYGGKVVYRWAQRRLAVQPHRPKLIMIPA
jgi:hypothetical protein